MQSAELFERLHCLKGKEYEFHKAGLPASVIEVLSSLARLFEQSSERERAEISSRVVPEISFLFLRFGDTMATKALRCYDERSVLQGLEALAIENCRFDWRDSTLTLALLYHSAARIGVDAEAPIRFVMQLASKRSKDQLFAPFLSRTPENRELAKFGMKEAQNQEGRLSYASL